MSRTFVPAIPTDRRRARTMDSWRSAGAVDGCRRDHSVAEAIVRVGAARMTDAIVRSPPPGASAGAAAIGAESLPRSRIAAAKQRVAETKATVGRSIRACASTRRAACPNGRARWPRNRTGACTASRVQHRQRRRGSAGCQHQGSELRCQQADSEQHHRDPRAERPPSSGAARRALVSATDAYRRRVADPRSTVFGPAAELARRVLSRRCAALSRQQPAATSTPAGRIVSVCAK